jgi:fumarate reductase flavoprotein subunit
MSKAAKRSQFRAFLFCILPLALAVGCDTSDDLYKAGTYRADEKGFNGPIVVSVTFSENRIIAVTIDDHSESDDPDADNVTVAIKGDVEECAPFVREALTKIPEAIIANQSAVGVDVVSGATTTSRAIILAARKCIRDASN